MEMHSHFILRVSIAWYWTVLDDGSQNVGVTCDSETSVFIYQIKWYRNPDRKIWISTINKKASHLIDLYFQFIPCTINFCEKNNYDKFKLLVNPLLLYSFKEHNPHIRRTAFKEMQVG
jgi:hypothetical protein